MQCLPAGTSLVYINTSFYPVFLSGVTVGILGGAIIWDVELSCILQEH